MRSEIDFAKSKLLHNISVDPIRSSPSKPLRQISLRSMKRPTLASARSGVRACPPLAYITTSDSVLSDTSRLPIQNVSAFAEKPINNRHKVSQFFIVTSALRMETVRFSETLIYLAVNTAPKTQKNIKIKTHRI